MQYGVMITHGPGGHPSWLHAQVSADQLIIDPKPEAENYGAKANAAQLLRKQVRDALEAHHETVKQHELDRLKVHGMARHGHPLEPEGVHLDNAVAAIVALTKGTVLEPHYARPEVQQAMREVLAVHFRTQQNIHRSEHLDNAKKAG
jgi:hypothetical protein